MPRELTRDLLIGNVAYVSIQYRNEQAGWLFDAGSPWNNKYTPQAYANTCECTAIPELTCVLLGTK